MGSVPKPSKYVLVARVNDHGQIYYNWRREGDDAEAWLKCALRDHPDQAIFIDKEYVAKSFHFNSVEDRPSHRIRPQTISTFISFFEGMPTQFSDKHFPFFEPIPEWRTHGWYPPEDKPGYNILQAR